MTLKHSFTSAIADDGAAQAAGEVLPSHWNADHSLSTTTGQVLYDASQSIAGDAGLTYNAATDALTVVGSINVPKLANLTTDGFVKTGSSDGTLSVDTSTYATQTYVDNKVQGSNYKEASKYATTAALPAIIYANGASGVGATLTGVAFGALSIDSNTPSVGDRILVKDQVSQLQNGIYTVTTVGSGIAVFVMTRAVDFDESSEVKDGDATYILAGTVNAGGTWVQVTTGTITMGTTAIVFSQMAGPGSIIAGTAISVSGLTVSVGDAELLALASTTSAADKLPYYTGAGTATTTDLTAAARSILDDASVGAIRTTLGVGTGDSPQFTGIELGNASDTSLTRSAAGQLAVEGVDVLTISNTKTFTGKSVGAGALTLEENASVALDPAGSADGKYTGITVTGTGGAVIAFGDLITLDKDDSRWELVDISVAAAATGDARGILGIAVTSSTDGTSVTVLLNGIVRADANFPALTIGAPVYASTAGDVVVAQPTTVDHVIRIIGYGLTADEMYFNPGAVWTTHT